MTVSDSPSSLNENEEINLNVTVSGAQAGTNYLRTSFYPVGTTSYFGYTFNGSTFYNDSDYTQYLPITIDSSGNWAGTVKSKVDLISSFYTGAGNYSLKVRRYTASGSYIWSNEISLQINSLAQTSPSSSPSTSSTPAPSASTQPSPLFSISNIPAKIKDSESFNAKVSLLLPSNLNTDYFLKGAFKKVDGTRYFGLTKNNNGWVEYADEYQEQLKITTDSSGSWSGNIEVKVDTNDKDYKGSGDYLIKVGRYTNGGSGPTWSNEINITIEGVATSPQPTTASKISDTNSSDNATTLDEETYSKSILPDLSHDISSVAGVTTSKTKPTLIKSDKKINFILIALGIAAGLGGGYYLVKLYKNR